MIKNILVPTDYSEASLNAFKTAVNIAVVKNACLHILHVKDVLPATEAIETKQHAKEIFDAMAGKVAIQHGIKTKVIYANGIVGHTIVNKVVENKIDLIIMGATGLSGQAAPNIGSNAYYVVKRSACPVLLIPAEKLWFEFKSILFPVRPTRFSHKLYKIIEEIIQGNKNTSRVQILSITTNWYEKTLSPLLLKIQEIINKDAAPQINISVSYSNSIDISDSVLMRAHELNADLIIISPGIDMPAKPFFIGPFSQKIINQAQIPILSIIRAGENMQLQS